MIKQIYLKRYILLDYILTDIYIYIYIYIYVYIYKRVIILYNVSIETNYLLNKLESV